MFLTGKYFKHEKKKNNAALTPQNLRVCIPWFGSHDAEDFSYVFFETLNSEFPSILTKIYFGSKNPCFGWFGRQCRTVTIDHSLIGSLRVRFVRTSCQPWVQEHAGSAINHTYMPRAIYAITMPPCCPPPCCISPPPGELFSWR